MSSVGSKGIMHTLRSAVEPPLDPSIVDNTAKLLDHLNKSTKWLHKRDERGYSLVHLAAERNQPESLKCLLIKDGTKPICLFLNAMCF